MRTVMPVAALLAVLAGCGGCGGPLSVELPPNRSSPPWLSDPDVVERTIAAAESAARVWGGDPGGLKGWTIRYESAQFAIDGSPVNGATQGSIVRIWAGGLGGRCPETSALSHEIGHVVIGDSGHSDPRWRDPALWERMAAALGPGVPLADADCRELLADKYASWRH